VTLRRTLAEGARAFGVTLSDEQADACLVYLVELEKWNRKINLTAIRDERDIIVKHFLDSFSYCTGFDPLPGTKLLDMGSGAGFPALPIKIAFPDVEVTMVESVQKKASFLRHIIRTLGLAGVEVINKRTNEVPDAYRSRYDCVTARAFAEMQSVLLEGTGFLLSGGRMILSRGPEESIPDDVVSALGMTLESRSDLILPYSDYRRSIWVFRKKG
jgi:16S rRNA (guanine527-N7)-methyltransferase